MKKKLLCATALVLSLNAHAENDAAWMRYSAISPDGQQIAFSYKGDIYTVGVNGGRANQITTNPAAGRILAWNRIWSLSLKVNGVSLPECVVSRVGTQPSLSTM